ncbi:MAG: hypothetical protein A2Z99_11285 [Treponema sp. GWB1_62_6]|nr:MAG: hypothetical protein A2Z99_11285 [Treponema sp. GWB1_62_6]OHE66971.1 MAG: hypothetical protein A2001_07945 [Treponema sp. GWC1_61_84]
MAQGGILSALRHLYATVSPHPHLFPGVLPAYRVSERRSLDGIRFRAVLRGGGGLRGPVPRPRLRQRPRGNESPVGSWSISVDLLDLVASARAATQAGLGLVYLSSIGDK